MIIFILHLKFQGTVRIVLYIKANMCMEMPDKSPTKEKRTVSIWKSYSIS